MTEPAAASSARPARPRRLRGFSIAFLLAIVALLAVAISSASAAVTEVNLAQYKRIDRFPLPLPPGTPAPAAQPARRRGLRGHLRPGHRNPLRRR